MMTVLVVKIFAFCILFAFQVVSGNYRIVETKVGTIKGEKAVDGDYYTFMGIPYATVNSSNTFGAAIPNPKLNGTFEAKDDSAQCPQLVSTFLLGSLDCLHLNVYVPALANSTNKLPVLVWIHGGSFTTGDFGRTIYGPSFIVRHDVILVTLNYRLGVYGFMCLHTPDVPGNQGLKDQLTGLRWIKSNIESFGGDSNKITVMGESAGSWSVQWHLLSPHEELFNQAIMQSGTVSNVQSVQEADTSSAIKLAQDLGFITNSTNEAISFLSTVDPLEVVRAAQSATSNYSLSVCIEKDFEGVERFVSQHPLSSNVQKVKNKNVMIGYTSDEGLTLLYDVPTVTLDIVRDNVFKTWLTLSFKLDSKQMDTINTIFTNFYTGSATVNDELRFQLTDFLSDLTFVYPTERTIRSFLANGADSIYYYKFSYLGGRNIGRIVGNMSQGGAVHSDELGYLFNMEILPEEPTPEDQLIIDRMTTLWTNFAKFGNPIPETTSLLPVKWQPVTNNTIFHYLDIDTNMSAGVKPFQHRTSFWDLFYNEYYMYELTYKGENNASTLSSVTFTLFIAFWTIFY